MTKGKPVHYQLKAAMVEEKEGPRLIVGLNNIDTQVRQEEEYNRRLAQAQTQANIDALTGVKNKHAYLEEEVHMDHLIDEHRQATKAKAEQVAKKVREEEEREKRALEAFYKKDLERLSYQASHDELTGLYNRFGYDFIISEMELSTTYLLMVDVDDFKTINDNYGHEVGDKVLIKIADTLRTNFRSDDCVCRIGGDEFVVVMVQAHTGLRALVKSKIEKINRELADSSDGLPPISISVGITFGSEASDAIELLKLADFAMYALKREGKQGYRFSDDAKGNGA